MFVVCTKLDGKQTLLSIRVSKLQTLNYKFDFLNVSSLMRLVSLRTNKKRIIQIYLFLGTCRNIYYITSDYTKHLLAEHSSYVCSLCLRSTFARYEYSSIPLFLNHLLEHKIGRYQCRYCVFGAETADVMLQHYTTEHCNKQPISYLRKFMKGNHNEVIIFKMDFTHNPLLKMNQKLFNYRIFKAKSGGENQRSLSIGVSKL